jgi:sensor histidine kinase YesM
MFKNQIFDVLKKTVAVSLILTLSVLSLCLVNSSMRDVLMNSIIVIFVSFNLTIFTGLYVSVKVKNIFYCVLISIIFSIGLIYLFDFLLFDFLYIKSDENKQSIKNIAILDVLVSILSCLFGIYNRDKRAVIFKKLNYPIVNALLLSSLIILIYAILSVFLFEGTSSGILKFLYDILFVNFLVIFIISLLLFKYIYHNFKNREFIITVFYFFVFMVFLISSFLQYDYINKLVDLQNYVSYIIARVPFVFMIMLSVQISFMIEISKRQKEQLIQQSLESQLNYQQLKNQLSPHFLFNNINVLTSLIEENPKKAILFSENLSHIYRCFLEQEKQDVVLLKEEIEFAKSYLALLKDRFETGLNFTISLDKKLHQKYIVSTILQQVLENVVKHNEISADKLIIVKIFTARNYLIIENNKNPKLKTDEISKKGIENIKKRIAFFTDEKVIIKNTDLIYRIELPLLETV